MAEWEQGGAPAAPEAPYGRTKDGKPRAKPGPAKGSAGVGGRRRTPAAPGRANTPRPPRASKPDYRPGIIGLGQLIAAPLGVIGARTGSVPLQADAAAVIAWSPPIADGLQSAADTDPRVAALLDRILKAGPYAVVLTPLIGLGLQLMVNHAVVPLEVAAAGGAMDPQELITAVTGLAAPDPGRPVPQWERDPEPTPVPVPDPVV